MSGYTAPPTGVLVKTAEELVPLIRSWADWSDEHRRLHDDVVSGLERSGLLNLRRPLRHGGYEADTATMTEVLATIAGADGSAAWTTASWLIGSWMTSMFPDHVQDEVFADPNARVCVVLSPTAVATATPDGLVVNGRWSFMSGALHATWQVVITMAPAPDGEQLWPVMALVPMSQLGIDDDWDTRALRGTGSVTTIGQDLFIPYERTIPMVAVMQNQYLSEANADSAVFTQPMLPTGASGFIGVAIGLAREAHRQFFERLPSRKITYTEYTSQAEAPLAHFQVAEAVLKLDEAEFHARRITDMLDDKGAAGESWSVEDRIRYRGSYGRMAQLAKESVDILATASGASSIQRDVPIQRVQNDLHALNLHALMHPDTNFELFGRMLCGQPPNTVYL